MTVHWLEAERRRPLIAVDSECAGMLFHKNSFPDSRSTNLRFNGVNANHRKSIAHLRFMRESAIKNFATVGIISMFTYSQVEGALARVHFRPRRLSGLARSSGTFSSVSE